MSHTPAPWNSNDAMDSDFRYVKYVIGPDGQAIAEVRSGQKMNDPDDYNKEEARANARLIQKSPVMASLLTEAVSRIDDLVKALGKNVQEVEDLAAWSDDARECLNFIAPPEPPCDHKFKRDAVQIPVCTKCGVEGEA